MGAIKMGVLLHHLPDASLRKHLLLNSRLYDTYVKMAAEIHSVATAKAAWAGPTPMDINAVGKMVCANCSKVGHRAEDCWSSPKGKGKGKKGNIKGKSKNKLSREEWLKTVICRKCEKKGHI